jgi:hypothetical protein
MSFVLLLFDQLRSGQQIDSSLESSTLIIFSIDRSCGLDKLSVELLRGFLLTHNIFDIPDVFGREPRQIQVRSGSAESWHTFC